MYRVKAAIDLNTQKKVAVKILKVKQNRSSDFSKFQSLRSFHTEIAILSSCNHPNIVKIKAASFDGTIVKELVSPLQTPRKCTEDKLEQQLASIEQTLIDLQNDM